MTIIPKLTFFEKYKDYAAVFLRLVVGAYLVYGTQDNVFSYDQMKEFAGFLRTRGVPFPLFSAFLSAYAQFICGLLFILGAATRYAAVVMMINFIAAIIIAHIGDTFKGMLPALMMLAAACFFLLHGAGKPSIDAMREKGELDGQS